MSRVALVALALTLTPACRERYRPSLDDVASPEANRDGRADSNADATDVEAIDAAAPMSRVTIVEVRGECSVDATLRCEGTRSLDGGLDGARAAVAGRSLFACDACATGDQSSLTLALSGGARVELGPDARVEVAGYVGASVVVTQGVATVSVPVMSAEPARVDTPAGRLIVSSGTALVAVADDGAVRVSVDVGAATWWASPTAPPARVTALSPAERTRLALASPGRPILLDVDLPELAAAEVRAVTSRPLDAGVSLAFTANGSPQLKVIPRATGAALRASVRVWLSARDAVVARRDAHLFAIDELSRAGAGDVADVRVALARIRTRGDLDGRDRDALLARASLALGRLTARARRGRALASRGGDVTALAQTAPLEELRAAMP